MQNYICIHSHFYQPPRENPWLEEVELQESAHPFHDWNERITAECYAPNTASRILDQDRQILEIVNNYSKISFNFGPTLLVWLEKNKPEIYEYILEADQVGQTRFSGHGTAMAQVYNHMIMPLANTRDKYTQVTWGIKDFQLRFGRDPEGMWLPETAVDLESLDIMAEMGISFTILSPHQAFKIRKLDSDQWIEVNNGSIDPKRPYKCTLPSGRSIALFFFDKPISQDIAFGGLLYSGESFAYRLNESFVEDKDKPQLVNVASDGETYGHHHRQGDMALAYCLYKLEKDKLAELTVYGEFLDKYPPAWEVEIFENSSWSCMHGVERWRKNCGCNSGMNPNWSQAWREPLRQAMNFLRDSLIQPYEQTASQFLKDPWQARDDYITVILDRSTENVDNFLDSQAKYSLKHEDKVTVLKLLELQRQAMLIFTSCGWFFDDISGIETVQLLRYAERAMQLAENIFDLQLHDQFVPIIEQAKSNLKKLGTGKTVFEKFVSPAKVDFFFVGSHFALSSLFEQELEDIQIFSYSPYKQFYELITAGNLKLAIGRIKIVSEITWDESLLSFAAAYLGEHNANCGIREYMNPNDFETMRQEIKEIFELGDVPELIRIMDKHFSSYNYTLWHLFKDEQIKVLNEILQSSLEETQTIYKQILDNHYSLLNFLTELHRPIPRSLKLAAETVVNNEIEKLLEKDSLDLAKIKEYLDMVENWDIQLDHCEISFKVGWCLENLLADLYNDPENLEILTNIEEFMSLMSPLDLELNLWKAQNSFFYLVQQHYPTMQTKAEQQDDQALKWIKIIQKLAVHLHVHVA